MSWPGKGKHTGPSVRPFTVRAQNPVNLRLFLVHRCASAQSGSNSLARLLDLSVTFVFRVDANFDTYTGLSTPTTSVPLVLHTSLEQ